MNKNQPTESEESPNTEASLPPPHRQPTELKESPNRPWHLYALHHCVGQVAFAVDFDK